MQWNNRVEEFTTPYPITATEDQTIDELYQLMQDLRVRHLPVLRGDAVVGVISDRDLRLARGLSEQHKIQIRAGDLMNTDPVTVHATTPLYEVASRMSERKIGSVLVNDAGGKLLGIFTITDALNALIEISRSSQN